MFQRAGFVGLLIIACGGATPLPEEPSAEATEPAADEGDDASEESAESSDESSAGDESASETSATTHLGNDDLTMILQSVLDYEEVTQHLALGEPGRFPLKVSGDALPSGVDLKKNDKPVVLVTEPEPKDAVLVFTEVVVEGEKVLVRFRYDIDGMKGTATVQKGPAGWEVTRTRFVERGPIEREER